MKMKSGSIIYVLTTRYLIITELKLLQTDLQTCLSKC